MKHTILGAGGSIGNALASELLKNKSEVRLVSRSGTAMPETISIKADLTNAADTKNAVKGSDVVYLCAGLPYEAKVWEEQWPKVMKNTIDACKASNAKLIFFDNVYMYGKVSGKMTEETPYNPCSKKGEVRAKIARMLDDENALGEIATISARAADLYGPYISGNSVPYFMAFEKMLKGKPAQWILNDNQPHSYTYTIDCAKALILLANDAKTFNQTWHLPTCNPPITGKEMITLIAKELHMSPKHSILAKWMISLAGLFNKNIREVKEMLYQYESPYYFDSSKFNTYFGYTPTSYEQGIMESISFYVSMGKK